MIYLILLCIVSPTDVNECSEETKCLGGTCINTDGSYMCRCETGFTHLPEAEQCTGKNHFKHSDHFILVLKCTVKFLISNKLDAKKLLNVQDFNLCLLNNILSKSATTNILPSEIGFNKGSDVIYNKSYIYYSPKNGKSRIKDNTLTFSL